MQQDKNSKWMRKIVMTISRQKRACSPAYRDKCRWLPVTRLSYVLRLVRVAEQEGMRQGCRAVHGEPGWWFRVGCWGLDRRWCCEEWWSSARVMEFRWSDEGGEVDDLGLRWFGAWAVVLDFLRLGGVATVGFIFVFCCDQICYWFRSAALAMRKMTHSRVGFLWWWPEMKLDEFHSSVMASIHCSANASWSWPIRHLGKSLYGLRFRHEGISTDAWWLRFDGVDRWSWAQIRRCNGEEAWAGLEQVLDVCYGFAGDDDAVLGEMKRVGGDVLCQRWWWWWFCWARVMKMVADDSWLNLSGEWWKIVKRNGDRIEFWEIFSIF